MCPGSCGGAGGGGSSFIVTAGELLQSVDGGGSPGDTAGKITVRSP